MVCDLVCPDWLWGFERFLLRPARRIGADHVVHNILAFHRAVDAAYCGAELVPGLPKARLLRDRGAAEVATGVGLAERERPVRVAVEARLEAPMYGL